MWSSRALGNQGQDEVGRGGKSMDGPGRRRPQGDGDARATYTSSTACCARRPRLMVMQFTTDGSSGQPGVRVAQFARAFPNSMVGSVCDPSYVVTMSAISTNLGALISGPCVVGPIRSASSGQPSCTVTKHLVDRAGKGTDAAVQSCTANGNHAPCWTLAAAPAKCHSGGSWFKLITDPGAQAGNQRDHDGKMRRVSGRLDHAGLLTPQIFAVQSMVQRVVRTLVRHGRDVGARRSLVGPSSTGVWSLRRR
jgi:hypothetical protein